ncbi:MAG TPA: hypothetical protein VF269_02960, partial [Rhodanobacteraceae bacterium]
WYELAWDVPAKDLTELYAIVQKWTDQGISADFFRRVIGDASITSTEMIENYLYRVKLGLKSKYYMNQKTSDGMQPLTQAAPAEADDNAQADSDCEACML